MINVIGLFTLPSTWLSHRNEIKMCVEWDFPGKSCKNHDGNKEWLILPKSIKHHLIPQENILQTREQIRSGLDNCGYVKRQIRVFFIYYFYYDSACSCSGGLTLLVRPENKPLATVTWDHEPVGTRSESFSKFRFFKNVEPTCGKWVTSVRFSFVKPQWSWTITAEMWETLSN